MLPGNVGLPRLQHPSPGDTMSRGLLFGLVLFVVSGAGVLHAGGVKETKSALESQPTGWLDLLAGKELTGWKHVAIPPGSKLKEKSCWRREGDTLVCDGVGVHEMLLYDREIADGIFHVEWRFKKLEGKKGYNSGVYVRNSADGKIWHQAQ